jgi:DivIVA domain-containing protein
MPLIPAQVRDVVFSKPPIGKRGYHESEVDAFLDVVQAELAQLLAENINLRNRITQSEQQPSAGVIDTAAVPQQPAALPMRQSPAGEVHYHYHATRVLHLAQQMTDRITTQAQAEADALLSQARTHAEQLVREAQSTADDLVSQAATRAKTMLHDARTRADAVDQQSRDKLATLTSQQHDELRHHTKIIAALRGDKTALEHRIQYLHTFDSDYRTHLRRFLRAQLQQLGAQQPDGPADPNRAPHPRWPPSRLPAPRHPRPDGHQTNTAGDRQCTHDTDHPQPKSGGCPTRELAQAATPHGSRHR